jgi:hypothetical protein
LLKAEVAHKNVAQSSANVQNLMMQVIENINVKDWKSAVSHVKKVEADYWARDCLLEEEI